MHVDVWGHAGARMIVFPTTMGTWREWPDRQMPTVLREHLDNGWIQMTCVDQVHDESWYGRHLHPGARAWRHLQYDAYIHAAYRFWGKPRSTFDLDGSGQRDVITLVRV